MPSTRNFLSVFFVLFLLFGSISAAPVKSSKAGAVAKPRANASSKSSVKPVSTQKKGKGTTGGASCKLHKRTDEIMIGYNGFNGNPRPSVIASKSGELGAVFYVADSIDLAKQFAKGPHGADKDTVCKVYANAVEWSTMPKVWVGPTTLAKGGNAMNIEFPGSVLFADHTTAGLAAGSPSKVHQLGVRQAQIQRLQLRVQCDHKESPCHDGHHTLDYSTKKGEWYIQEAK